MDKNSRVRFNFYRASWNIFAHMNNPVKIWLEWVYSDKTIWRINQSARWQFAKEWDIALEFKEHSLTKIIKIKLGLTRILDL